MVKEVFFFTEMGYTAYPQDDARRRGYNNLMFPNEHFSPERAPGYMTFWGREGLMPHDAAIRGIDR